MTGPSIQAYQSGLAVVPVDTYMQKGLKEIIEALKAQQLYCGHLSVQGLNEEDLPKTKVNVFMASTFDDTKFE